MKAIKANLDIREKARKENVMLWECANALGLHDCNFSRKLRHELPQQEKDQIFAIIEKIKVEREEYK